MQQKITGYHLDEFDDWVAELELLEYRKTAHASSAPMPHNRSFVVVVNFISKLSYSK